MWKIVTALNHIIKSPQNLPFIIQELSSWCSQSYKYYLQVFHLINWPVACCLKMLFQHLHSALTINIRVWQHCNVGWDEVGIESFFAQINWPCESTYTNLTIVLYKCCKPFAMPIIPKYTGQLDSDIVENHTVSIHNKSHAIIHLFSWRTKCYNILQHYCTGYTPRDTDVHRQNSSMQAHLIGALRLIENSQSENHLKSSFANKFELERLNSIGNYSDRFFNASMDDGSFANVSTKFP